MAHKYLGERQKTDVKSVIKQVKFLLENNIKIYDLSIKINEVLET